jgi:ribosomal protein L16 Arg81 hydroxylase
MGEVPQSGYGTVRWRIAEKCDELEQIVISLKPRDHEDNDAFARRARQMCEPGDLLDLEYSHHRIVRATITRH